MNKTETWYAFDMNPEHVDPRLIYWLHLNGIVLKLNNNCYSPGVIASTYNELPEFFIKQEEDSKLYPVTFSLGVKDRVPNIKKLIEEHDTIHEKPHRWLRNPLFINYGRYTKQDISDCLSDWLDEVSILISRVEEVDEKAIASKHKSDIESIKQAIASIKSKL
ncbi:hypothetical protein PCC6912_50960 [Chlorogloeopsis fritschii PCC 6912]|uniref:Uncharacterized protein n=1 Tax=Chlorogloeopsis fritschii PCC 6912 TaxID=211165 RepID=A0A433N1N2_CHLFR|nr:hypothetical protein [Chlorogloeopsis fritschii]RUR74918.1 hypothetical protein PCC6912_50960 [Chlorogloeopsis fritschii PCC 6912]